MKFSQPDQKMQLSDDKKRLIIAALQACAPSGGGSNSLHLAMELIRNWGVDAPDELVGALQAAAHEEYVWWHS